MHFFFILTHALVIIGIMKHLTMKYEGPLYTSSLLDFYFSVMRIGVLDIETTGLSPARNKFILGGLLDLQTMTMHQYFAENRGEERQVLEDFAEKVSGLDMVITYNGRHFDMPFINRRLQRFSAGSCTPYDLDLYLVVNGHSPIKKFVPNLKQKTVESYMGLWPNRADEISGAESVELYDRYEKTGDPELCRKILLHNSDDVLQLARLLKVVSKTDFHKAMFHLGFPVCGLNVEKIGISGSIMTVSGSQRAEPFDYTGFSFGDYPAEIRFSRRDSDFHIKFPVIRDSGLVIADLDAAGLPREDFAIYPSYSSGFIVLEDHDRKNHMEINQFIRDFIKSFIRNL